MRLAALLLALFLTLAPAQAQPGVIRAPRLGITFISSLDHPANERRYQQALLLGAGWNRWPLYWDRVETAPGSYNWSSYDRLVTGDVVHGLRTNAILLGRPGFFADGGSISNLAAPAFSDGSDTPGAGKLPNSGNPWALFVYAAVQRYKPGGQLALNQGWPAGAGITVWEAWNEPDLPLFWTGGEAAYARLLKLTYLLVKQADPNAKVMFGGLAYGNPDENDWLAKTLNLIAADPQRDAYNWYMDIVAVHSYTYARRTGLVVRRMIETLGRFGLSRPVWVNESGVSVWDDYPGPVWTSARPEERRFRATQAQQAAFVVESTVYAWAAGADVVFIHQLYDDCGDAPGNFPPHNGELCGAQPTCSGDAYGLYRNERGESCFSQHPNPGSPRPAAAAFYRLAQIFGTATFNDPKIERRGSSVIASFMRPTTGERVLALWNRTLEPLEVDFPAAGSAALVYSLDQPEFRLIPVNGRYSLGLPPATRDDFPYLPVGEISGIGGPPLLLVERLDPALVAGLTPSPVATVIPLDVTPGISITQVARPTVDPAFDTRPPVTRLEPLPEVSPTVFTVRWSAEDDGGIDKYLVWVRIDEGEWQPWLETPGTEGQYIGQSGSAYAFAVWAVDLAGNWSLNTELSAQATTRVE